MHNWWPDTWKSNSRRQRHPPALDDEELFIIEGSPAETGAQLRDNPEEREKWPQKAEKPLHHRGLPSCDWPSSDDELNLRHPQPARRPAQQGHRSPCQSTATAGLPQFSTLSNQAPVVVQQRVSQPVQELHLCDLNGLLHS